ncbi:hypothetical protein IFM89_036792 [Coptis chinensis]|uniref:Glycosyltransferase 61 catalytic domain-containing protein n=1 Tax=Coptis chinensis TaxID=261450 RepID=A0A835LU82_9MAGN|nr:hypothetical protein IFM89_036792 [Coptis chinensis]
MGKKERRTINGSSPRHADSFEKIDKALRILPISSPLSSSTSWSTLQHLKTFFTKTYHFNCSRELEAMASKLQHSVTFLPLKDLRFAHTAMDGNTWFMSSICDDAGEEGETEHLYFPSEASKGRLLCVAGNDSHYGERNLYGFAWKDSLPANSTLMEGLTFVSDTYYDYTNLWHGLTAMAPFVSWYKRNGCESPSRWVLYHWGELRTGMGSWHENLMKATFGELKVEGFGKSNGSSCFEKAVVMRHNIGKMGKREGLSNAENNKKEDTAVRLTLLMRKGARSFKNESLVVKIFSNECARVKGCKLTVTQSENLSFCDQVRAMSFTDIVASPHGAQLTNMLFMDRNSSVMEFFPNGWWEYAGIGKYAHHWMADYSGMKHLGAWWDPQVEKECPHPEKESECFGIYKNGQVGHNETFFTEWARNAINQVKVMKQDEFSTQQPKSSCVCARVVE